MYFERFCDERNIVKSTINGYKTTVNKYTTYYETTMDKLIQEAIDEEENGVGKRQRNIKNRLVQFRTHLLTDTNLKVSTIRNHIKKLKTIYKQFDVEVPDLPQMKDSDVVETTYYDLPTREQIKMAVDIAGIKIASLILFMASSGTGRKECANMTIKDFVLDGCKGYYTKETLHEIIEELYYSLTPIVPTLYLLRVKTGKKYYTFCTPEATDAILEWLMLWLQVCEVNGKELSPDNKLWDMKTRQITSQFQQINDELEFGFKGEYRFFRPHTLRKFNGSNIGLSDEKVDLIHGRSKDSVHATYIKTNPEELKKIYMNVMDNVVIGKDSKKEIIHEDFTINMNLNFYGGDCGVSL